MHGANHSCPSKWVTTESTVSNHWGKRFRKVDDSCLFLLCRLSLHGYGDGKRILLSAALQTNIWSASGTGMKNKDINED